MSRPPKFQLVDLKLGGRLEHLLVKRRRAQVSYDAIAREVWDETGIPVTGPTIRNWTLLLAGEEPAEVVAS